MTGLSDHLRRGSRKGYWAARTVLAWGLGLAMFVTFSITVPHFFSFGNLYALVQIFAALALLATGLGVVMLAGEFDLSIAGTFPLAGLIVIEYADGFRTYRQLDRCDRGGDCLRTSSMVGQWDFFASHPSRSRSE